MSIKQISEIWVYPIKSLGGISLKSATVKPKGFDLDRRWMLVDGNNRFITQRNHSSLALFKISLHGNQLQVNYHDHFIEVPIIHEAGPLLDAVIWDDVVRVVEVSPLHSSWFSDKLGINCKLVCFPEENTRPVDPRYRIADDQVSLSDGYPYLIIGQRSLDDLNSRLKDPVPMNRFRPNLVFTGGESYEEDTWRNFRIGKNRFAGVKRCGRCVLTTVNQTTGERGTEPLATLATYRKEEAKIVFGQNLIALNYEEVNVGDSIILEGEE